MNADKYINKTAHIVLQISGLLIALFLIIGVSKDISGIQCYGFLGRSTTCMNPLTWYDIDKVGGEVGAVFIVVNLLAIGIVATDSQNNSTSEKNKSKKNSK